MDVNQWFLSLPEGRQKAIRDDKWLLAQAAADAATSHTEWTPCTDWNLIPDGEWLVKIENDRKPYHVANAFTNPSGKIVIVGGMFSFDAGNLIAYAPFGRYE